MRVVVQRVLEASVSVQGEIVSKIGKGFLILAGFEESDTKADLDWIAAKIKNLRVFSDADGLMNRSILDVEGDAIVVSQFTLFASTRKGNRPSFIRAAKPELAQTLYEKFVEQMRIEFGKPVFTGKFGADMSVSLINDGPVTICMDSRARE